MAANDLPTLRWGILGTGWVSTNFGKDLLLPRPEAPVKHIIQAIGTSSQAKGATFLSTIAEHSKGTSLPQATIYTDYEDVYNDPNVDIVYVGTPHSLHKEECLKAIAKGKHVLCEKPMAINAKEAEEMIEAARSKGVFFMEAVWTRFFPLVKDLQKWLHQDKILGDVTRMFCDFGLEMNIPSLPSTSRLKSLELGAGALLDVSVYPLMYSNVLLDGKVGSEASDPEITSAMVLEYGIDVEDVIIVKYPRTKRVGVLTASLRTKTKEPFCRIEGSKGFITLDGPGTSLPRKVKIVVNGKEEVKEYNHEGMGFYFEADAVAMDILAGRKESDVIPLSETVRMMKVMDGIRRSGGLVYPQDE